MNPKTLLVSAHWAMAITSVLSLSIFYVAYNRHTVLTISVQVMLHVGMIIFPALFKISYIIRLTALKQLGRTAD